MSLKIKSVVALALSAAMLFPTAACGTSDASNSGDSSDSSNTTTGYDVSTIKKDDELAKLVPSGALVKAGELSAGMEPSYAPAEFYAEDGIFSGSQQCNDGVGHSVFFQFNSSFKAQLGVFCHSHLFQFGSFAEGFFHIFQVGCTTGDNGSCQ